MNQSVIGTKPTSNTAQPVHYQLTIYQIIADLALAPVIRVCRKEDIDYDTV